MKPITPLLLLTLLVLTACSSLTSTPPKNRKIETEAAIRAAKRVLGTPYVYGGYNQETGFDCSGLMVYSYLHAGIQLPRTALLQFKTLRPVRAKDLQVGDLLFFRKNRGRISHVGLYIGNKQFIHAPSHGKTVSIARLDKPYWQKRFVRAGRIRNTFHFENRI